MFELIKSLFRGYLN